MRPQPTENMYILFLISINLIKGNTDHGVTVKSASVSNRGGGRTKTVNIDILPYTYVNFIMKNY